MTSAISFWPVEPGGLHTLISGRLGRSLPRPTMVRIAEVPRAIRSTRWSSHVRRALNHRPSSRSCHARWLNWCVPGSAISTTKSATYCWLRRAHRSDGRPAGPGQRHHRPETVVLLEKAESKGIVGIKAIGFASPTHCLPRAYTPTPVRRGAERCTRPGPGRGAPGGQSPAPGAGHDEPGPATLEALDAAAEAARARGAPATAAELVDFAIGLGGDTPLRRIRASRNHFHAGNYRHARALLEPVSDELQPGPLRATAVGLLAEMPIYHNSFAQAAEMLHRALKDAEGDRALLVQTLILLSFASVNTGAYEGSRCTMRAKR